MVFASAVSSVPPTIAPACPIVLPAGAVCPAIKPTTGLVPFALIHLAASASNCQPISPIIMIPSVSGSFMKSSTASLVVVPIIGSPPIPMAVETPKPAFTA